MCMPGNNLYFYANLYMVISILVLQNHGQNALPHKSTEQDNMRLRKDLRTLAEEFGKASAVADWETTWLMGGADVICWLIDDWRMRMLN